jgi:hypothetical protein
MNKDNQTEEQKAELREMRRLKYLATTRRWQANNWDRYLEYQREYQLERRAQNREANRAYFKKYRDEVIKPRLLKEKAEKIRLKLEQIEQAKLQKAQL